MQIIDELEVNKRGPYGGGIGYVAYNGNMDVALALRTMVIPNPTPAPTGSGDSKTSSNDTAKAQRKWTVHLQVSCVCVEDDACDVMYETRRSWPRCWYLCDH